MAGNTSRILGVGVSIIDRKFAYGTSMRWMPATNMFGPKGGYGHGERHE